MPENIAKKVSEGVYGLHTNTAGGKVRFKTDSSYVVVHAKMDGTVDGCHATDFGFASMTKALCDVIEKLG